MAASRQRSFVPVFVFLIVAVSVAFIVWRELKPSVAPTAHATLHPVAFADLPGWSTGDPGAAFDGFRRSCMALAGKPQDASMGSGGYAGTAKDWQAVCALALANIATPVAARRFFEQNFVPVAITQADGSEALFTGYYEPELFASRTQHGAYRTPIYAPPADLVSVDLGAFRDQFKGEHLEGCLAGHTLLPCPTRAQIDAAGLNGAPVLFYADDPLSVFFLHIQGSGRVRLADGGMVRVAYAGQNGRPYISVARTLIDRGALSRDGMSMQVIRSWMKGHPAEARDVMETDPSYVFFTEAPLGDPSLGSPGSEGVALTPRASVAIDSHLHPLGAPIYVATTRPDSNPAHADRVFDQLLVAQDTGGAIRGPARGDVFWGFGQEAESIAGRMKSRGRMFVLLPKSVARRLAPDAELRAP